MDEYSGEVYDSVMEQVYNNASTSSPSTAVGIPIGHNVPVRPEDFEHFVPSDFTIANPTTLVVPHDVTAKMLLLTSPSSSSAFCRSYEFMISVILVSVTAILGSAGNILTLTVLHHTRNHSVTVFLLNALAISDLIMIMLLGVLLAVPASCRSAGNCTAYMVDTVIVYMEQYGWAVASCAHSINVYITVLVTVHRYITVCKPPNVSARFSTRRHVTWQLVLVCVCGCVYNIPRLFEYEPNPEASTAAAELFSHNADNITSTHSTNCSSSHDLYVTGKQASAIGKNFWYQLIYKNICYYLFIFIIPLTVLTTMSYRLGQVVRTRIQQRKKLLLSRRQGREDNTTFVLIIIVIIFLVCQTPTNVQRLVFLLSGGLDSCGHVFFYLSKITDYLVVLNCSVNFIVYVLFARQFRQSLWDIVFPGCASKRTISRIV